MEIIPIINIKRTHARPQITLFIFTFSHFEPSFLSHLFFEGNLNLVWHDLIVGCKWYVMIMFFPDMFYNKIWNFFISGKCIFQGHNLSFWEVQVMLTTSLHRVTKSLCFDSPWEILGEFECFLLLDSAFQPCWSIWVLLGSWKVIGLSCFPSIFAVSLRWFVSHQ